MRRTRIWPLISLVICCSVCGCSDDDADDPTDASDASDASDAVDISVEDVSSADGSASDADADADTDVEHDAEPQAMMLVDHDMWSPVAVGADPFDDAPDQVECDEAAWGTEEIAPELTFFVQTQGCNYLTVTQPTTVAIRSGETVNVRLWHYDLTAPAASEAHLGLRLGDHLLWEDNVPIPSDSALLMDTWTAPADIPAGEDIYFHVHNHGNNEYNLIEVSVSR